MSPYGMYLLNVYRAHWFSPAQVSRVVVVKHHVVIEVNHCVARVSTGEWLPDNDVAWLRLTWRYLVKAIERHVFQVEVFTT